MTRVVVQIKDLLTNEAVLKMLKAGLSEDVVVGAVNASPGKYSTAPDDLIALKTAGVPDKVVSAMVSKGLPSKRTVTVVARPEVRLHEEHQQNYAAIKGM